MEILLFPPFPFLPSSYFPMNPSYVPPILNLMTSFVLITIITYTRVCTCVRSSTNKNLAESDLLFVCHGTANKGLFFGEANAFSPNH